MSSADRILPNNPFSGVPLAEAKANPADLQEKEKGLERSTQNVRDQLAPALGDKSFNDAFFRMTSYGKNDVIAGNPFDDLSHGIDNLAHPKRENPDKGLDYKATLAAYKASGLSKYGIDPTIIAGTLRNENVHQKIVDVGEDQAVRQFGTAEGPLTPNPSIGDAQMQQNTIRYLVDRYPQLAHMKDDPLRKSLENKNASMLVGAFYEETARRLENHQDPISSYHFTHADEARENIRGLWNSGDPVKRTDALIRSYNPGDGQAHVNNVRSQMRQTEKRLAKFE